jgi:hypothetical protein
MRHRKPAGLGPHWRTPEPLHTHTKLAAMAAIAALPLFLLASLVPGPLVLPVLCLIMIAGAAIASAIAWRAQAVRNAQHVTAWDIAGAFAFIACAAAMLSSPEHIFSLADSPTTLAELTGRSRSAHP